MRFMFFLAYVDAEFRDAIKYIQGILEYWNVMHFIEGFYFRNLWKDIFEKKNFWKIQIILNHVKTNSTNNNNSIRLCMNAGKF